MLVARKITDDPHVHAPHTSMQRALARVAPRLDQLPARRYRQRTAGLFSAAWMPDLLLPRLQALRPDIVHLHWINYGFVGIETLSRIRRPLVWTLHDMWPFTGGCHYAGPCERYRTGCGSCPQLGSTTPGDLSMRTMRRKRAAWSALELTVIAPSRWLGALAQGSALFSSSRIEVIPNCLDTVRFSPRAKAAARAALGLPQDRLLVLFVALDADAEPRKGFTQLEAALGQLAARFEGRPIDLMVLGDATERPGDFPLRMHRLGVVHDDERIALAYCAADVFVAPSVEDNLPNTVLEAMSCGVACVAFDVGGIPDMVVHAETGYLARAGSAADLAAGIVWVLESTERRDALGAAGRRRVEAMFAPGVGAARHRDLYSDLTDRAAAARPRS